MPPEVAGSDPDSIDLRKTAVWLVAAMVIFLPLLLLDSVQLAASLGDEGVILQGAKRVALGQVPYRDFFTVVTPGTFYILAALFKVLGVKLFAARLLVFLCQAAIVILFLKISSHVGISEGWKALGALALLPYGTPIWFVASHHWLATAFTLLSFSLLLDALAGRHPFRNLFLSGATASLTAFTMQDQGLYALVAFGAVAFFLAARERKLKDVVSFASGAGIVALPLTAYFLVKAPFKDLWMDLVHIPLTTYRALEGNAPPIGRGWDLPLLQLRGMATFNGSLNEAMQAASNLGMLIGNLLVLVSFPLALLIIGAGILRGRRMGRNASLPVALFALIAVMALSAMHRPAMINFVWSFTGPLLGGLFLLHRVSAAWKPLLRNGLIALLALPFAVAGICNVVLIPVLAPSELISLPGGNVRSYRVQEQESLRLAAKFKKDIYNPVDGVFCFCYDPAYYFFLDLKNCTRYDMFEHAYNGPEQTREIMASLQTNPPEWLLLDKMGQLTDPVTMWIIANYEGVATSDFLVVARRKSDIARPGAGSSPL